MERMKKGGKIALFGGTFNPIHIGHLLTGYEILEKLDYDYILYVPTNISVHKERAGLASPVHRLEMVKLGVQGNSKFLWSDVEINRGGSSYTYDTVLEIKKLYQPEQKIGLIVGDEWLPGLPGWRNYDKLMDLVEVICLSRLETKPEVDFDIRYVNNRVIQLSSTEIRDRIKKNKPIDFMVPNNVKEYIMKYSLYRF